MNLFICLECLPWVTYFTGLSGVRRRRTEHGCWLLPCRSGRVRGRRVSGLQSCPPSICQAKTGCVFLPCVKNLLVSLGLEMSDTGLFFSESTHSLLGEADVGITQHNYIASQNEICWPEVEMTCWGAQLKDFNSDGGGENQSVQHLKSQVGWATFFFLNNSFTEI